jgi:putative ABC transport system ATP-binding protein
LARWDFQEIPLTALDSGNALFLVAELDGRQFHYFVLRSSDGTYRAAFDACDVCFRANRGYRQEGDLMVCNQCGQTFPSVKINEVKGGCNPAALPGAKVSAIRQVVESRKEAVDQFRRLGMGVSAIVLAIAGLMVFVTVMGNVQERTREIGVLRAVGFRKRAILSLLFWETGWVSLLASTGGAAIGLAVGTLALSGKEKSARAEALLASVGLSGKEERFPSQLSGGECQRVAIARSLIHDPPILLADEPTGNLDSATGEQILDLYTELNRHGKTVLLVTHNRANLKRATRAVRLKDGEVVEDDRLLAPYRAL